jgi:hypothetical protein
MACYVFSGRARSSRRRLVFYGAVLKKAPTRPQHPALIPGHVGSHHIDSQNASAPRHGKKKNDHEASLSPVKKEEKTWIMVNKEEKPSSPACSTRFRCHWRRAGKSSYRKN